MKDITDQKTMKVIVTVYLNEPHLVFPIALLVSVRRQNPFESEQSDIHLKKYFPPRGKHFVQCKNHTVTSHIQKSCARKNKKSCDCRV